MTRGPSCMHDSPPFFYEQPGLGKGHRTTPTRGIWHSDPHFGLLARQVPDVLARLSIVLNFHRNQPRRFAVLELNLGSPDEFYPVPEPDLIDHTAQVCPSEAAPVVAHEP